MRAADEVSFFSVGIHGLRIVGDKSTTLIRRILWLLLILATLGLTGWYWVDRTSFFVSNPLQTSITIAERQILVLPDVTICTRHQFNMTKLADLWKSFTGNSSLPPDADYKLLRFVEPGSLWEAAAYEHRGLITECTYMLKEDCLDSAWWTSRMTSYGKCFTLRGPQVSSSGEKFGLKIKFNETRKLFASRLGFMPVRRGWQIAVHPHGVPPDMILIEAGIVKTVRDANVTEGRNVDVSEVGRISVTVSEFERLPLDGSCVSDEDYTYEGCKIACFQEAVLRACGCRMSFMNEVEGPLCKTLAEVRNLTNYLNAIYFDGIWSPASCGCQEQCKETVYTRVSDTVSVASPAGTGQGRLWVHFQQMSPTVTKVEEEPAYDFTKWFSSIGGVSNFMMGVSVLTLAQIFDVFCMKLTGYLAWFPSSRVA